MLPMQDTCTPTPSSLTSFSLTPPVDNDEDEDKEKDEEKDEDKDEEN